MSWLVEFQLLSCAASPWLFAAAAVLVVGGLVAAGANETSGPVDNYNYQNGNGTPNGWPRTTGVWRHSDLKDVAYFYLWKLFEKIRRGE